MKVSMLQVGPIGTNCYLLEDEKTREAAVIDPGGNAPEIVKALGDAKLRYILLTHGHYDHTGGAAELLEAFPRAAVYIHRADFQDVDPSLFPLRTQVQGTNYYGEGTGSPLARTGSSSRSSTPPATPRAASPCAAATCSSAGTPSSPGPAEGRTSPAAACRRSWPPSAA